MVYSILGNVVQHCNRGVDWVGGGARIQDGTASDWPHLTRATVKTPSILEKYLKGCTKIITKYSYGRNTTVLDAAHQAHVSVYCSWNTLWLSIEWLSSFARGTSQVFQLTTIQWSGEEEVARRRLPVECINIERSRGQWKDGFSPEIRTHE